MLHWKHKFNEEVQGNYIRARVHYNFVSFFLVNILTYFWDWPIILHTSLNILKFPIKQFDLLTKDYEIFNSINITFIPLPPPSPNQNPIIIQR